MAKSKRNSNVRSRKNNSRKKSGVLRLSSRFSTKQLVVFSLVFALFGGLFIYRSFADEPLLLVGKNLKAADSLRASLVTETVSKSKRDTQVIQVANGSVNCPADPTTCGKAGLVDIAKPLAPGKYEACLVARVPSGTMRASLEVKMYVANTPADTIASGTFDIPVKPDYAKAGCVAFTIGATTEVQALVTNLVANNSFRIGSVIVTRKANIAHVASVKAGKWSDPTVWNTGKVPVDGDRAIISHEVTYDKNNSQVTGVHVRSGGALVFNPNAPAVLQTNANVLVEGTLRMKPAGPVIYHTLRFINVNEERFVGGGMDPIESDVGLWVMGSGQLDVAGSAKTAWTRLSSSAPAGTTKITLEVAPQNWQVGDELVIAPTQPNDYKGFDGARVSSVSGNTVTLDRPIGTSHPKVANRWGAEVMNLTRNVRIEGTGEGGSNDPVKNGRVHVFIRSTKPQSILYATFRYTGPRPNYVSKNRPVGAEQKWPSPMDIFGRYALHFHHSGDGSQGSTVEGTVIRDAGNHAYVPHTSHGITFRSTISYNTTHDAYWWDGPRLKPGGNLSNWREYQLEAEITNKTLIENAIAAKVRSGSNIARLSGFELGKGSGNVVRNSVAVGVQESQESNGFEWPEAHEGLWGFTGNVAHNNAKNGILSWQNTDRPHAIRNFTAYHNENGIRHGAYTNNYTYSGGVLYGNSRTGILLDAVAQTDGKILFENYVVDGGGVGASGIETTSHRASRNSPTVISNFTFQGGFTGKAAVYFKTGGENWDRIDFINPVFVSGNQFYRERLVEGSVIRVQNGTAAYQLTPDNKTGSTFVNAWNLYRKAIPVFQ